MVIAVSGGAGFVGSAFIRYISRTHPEDRIICFDALTYAADLHNLDEVSDNSGFAFIEGDITKKDDVEKLFSFHPDVLVNFAAESHVDRSIEDPGLFIRTNVYGTGVLLDACIEHGIGRFHQISTDEVYGDLPLDRNDAAFTESSPLKPSSPYSASKAGADLLVLSYIRTYGMNATISRSSNNYGPGQNMEKLIPKTVWNALHGIRIPVYGDGLNVRDWIHTDDHARAVDLIIRDGKSGEIYNIGAENEIRNIDLIRKILSILGRPEDLISFVPDRKGHDRRYAINPEKIRKELGFRAEQRDMEETILGYASVFS